MPRLADAKHRNCKPRIHSFRGEAIHHVKGRKRIHRQFTDAVTLKKVVLGVSAKSEGNHEQHHFDLSLNCTTFPLDLAANSAHWRGMRVLVHFGSPPHSPETSLCTLFHLPSWAVVYLTSVNVTGCSFYFHHYDCTVVCSHHWLVGVWYLSRPFSGRPAENRGAFVSAAEPGKSRRGGQKRGGVTITGGGPESGLERSERVQHGLEGEVPFLKKKKNRRKSLARC